MGWDSSRPVPWLRLVREWLVYAAIMVAVFAAFYSDNLVNGLVGLLISGPLYLALGVVLAKFGYKRKTIKQMRAERVDRTTDSTSPAATSVARTRPAPTRRTAGGGRSNRPGNRRR